MNDQRQSASSCPECEEHSFCNSEGREIETPYVRENCDCTAEKDGPNNEKKIIKRLGDAIGACNKNPYFKQTCIYQTDIYKSKRDTTPVDSIRMEHTASASLCALAIMGAAIGGAMLLMKCICKKKENG